MTQAKKISKRNSFNLNSLNSEVDFLFRKTVRPLPKSLLKKMDYLYQGKRIRTKLIFNSAKILGCNLIEIAFPAYAVELIHTVSLLHDDVIDVDSKRRGAETINSLFDNQAAVFLGDFLIKNLFLNVHALKAPPRLKKILLLKLNEICEGELLQNSFSLTKKKITKNNLINIAKKKTGALFALSAALPGLIKETNEEIIDFFESCGYAFGISYQLIDDYKDMVEDRGSNKNSAINYSLQFKDSDFKHYPKVFFDKTLEKIEAIFSGIKRKKKEKFSISENFAFYELTYQQAKKILSKHYQV